MTMPNLSLEQIAQISELVTGYITAQHDTYIQHAKPLTAGQRAAMEGFFRPELLTETRLHVLERERVANPDFYPMLKQAGFDNLPDMSAMDAITYSNCVVAHVPFSDALLFHELVHVEQYRQLGVPRFSNLYLLGFLSGGGYSGIPLERNAYTLGDRFEKSPNQHFDVAEEVGLWISESRF